MGKLGRMNVKVSLSLSSTWYYMIILGTEMMSSAIAVNTFFSSLPNLLHLKEKCIFSQFSRTKSLIYEYKVKDCMNFFPDLHQSFPTVISILRNIKQIVLMAHIITLMYHAGRTSPVPYRRHIEN